MFDDPNLPGEMVTIVTLRDVSCGTELNVVQEGVPEAIPLEFCYLGWQESLEHLARLVEPEIPAPVSAASIPVELSGEFVEGTQLQLVDACHAL